MDYLGAQVPTAHLIGHVHRTGPDAVCLSSSLPTRLPLAHSAITAVQAAGTPVMAGGLAFGADGRYARLLGADAWAPDARTAGDRLAAGPLTRPDLLEEQLHDSRAPAGSSTPGVPRSLRGPGPETLDGPGAAATGARRAAADRPGGPRPAGA